MSHKHLQSSEKFQVCFKMLLLLDIFFFSQFNPLLSSFLSLFPLFMFHCPRLHSITTFFHFFSCLPQSVNSYTPLFNLLFKREIFQREDGIERDARVSVIFLLRRRREEKPLSLLTLFVRLSVVSDRVTTLSIPRD
jgi:hypothetical protein